jgi:hypothetical protein
MRGQGLVQVVYLIMIYLLEAVVCSMLILLDELPQAELSNIIVTSTDVRKIKTYMERIVCFMHLSQIPNNKLHKEII